MNKITLTRTKFTDIKSGQESYGYRIYDDYGSSYAMFDKAQVPERDDDFLKVVSNGCDEQVAEMIQYSLEHGMYIDDLWYSSEKIEEILACSE